MEDLDVLVVGAGLLGVASAYHILKEDHNKKVLVVDRYGAPGQGNTGRSNAMFRNTFSSRDNQVLSNASIDYYLSVQNGMKVDVGLEQIGYLWLMSEPQLAANEAHLAGMEKNGIQVKRHSGNELASLIPGLHPDGDGGGQASLMGLPRADWGIFGPKCGRLDPEKLVRFYADEVAKMGGRFAFNTEAESLSLAPQNRLGVDGEPFAWQEWNVESVQLHGGTSRVARPKVVVLACGAWGNELLGPIGLDGHVRAKKRQLFSVPAKQGGELDGLLRTRGFNKLGLLPMVILPKGGVHFKPLAEEGAFWVGCEDEANRPFIDFPDHDLGKYSAEPEYYERGIKPVLGGYFPGFADAGVKAMWAGLYSYNTADFLPFAFRRNNLIAVGGDSGSGIMKGDALGRITSALYSEKKEALLYGGVSYTVSKLSLDRRDVEREEWVI